MKALFIDDESLIRRGLQSFIDWEKYGFDRILEASNGTAGIELIQKENPELVLLDIRMPDMDGIEVCEKARTTGYKGRIIIISGYSDFSYAKSALTWDVTEYLLKPVDADELEAAVVKSLREIRKENLFSYYEGQDFDAPKMTLLKSLLTGKTAYTPDLEQQWQLGFSHYFQLTSLSFPENIPKSAAFADKLLSGLKSAHHVVMNDILFILILCPQDKTAFQNSLKENLPSLPPGSVFIVYGRNFSDPARLNNEYEELMDIQQNIFFHNNAEGICFPESRTDSSARFDILGNAGDLVTAILTANKADISSLLSQLSEQLKQRKSPVDVTAMILCNYYQQILEILLLPYPNLEVTLPDQHSLLNRLGSLRYLYEYMDCLKQLLFQAVDAIQSSNAERPFSAIQAYIDANLTTPLKLEEVAALFGYNSTYLGKLFKKETGSSFNSYLNEKRIEYAKTLLQKNVSITEAASRSGYSNFNYFAMIFKQLTGDTPSRYRAKFHS